MKFSFSDLLPALLVAAVSAFFPGAALWYVAFEKAFITTLVLTAASKLLAPNAPTINTALLSRTQTLRTPIGSRQIIYGQARIGGQVTFANILGVTNQFGQFFRTMNLVITFAGHEVQEIGDIWFDAEVIPLDGNGNATGRLAGNAAIDKKLGTDNDTAFAGLLALGGILNTFRQRGCAKIWAILYKNNDLYPNGVPNITAVIKGKKVFDPRTGLTVWSQNAALCIVDYLCTPKKKGGLGCDYATEIDQTDLIAAANICDQDVALASGGTEKRYALNGAFLCSMEPKSVLQSMLSAMAGSLICIGGVWHIQAGAYVAPTVTLDEGDARGAIRTQTRMSRAEIFNGVKGVYISPANNWQPTDYTPVTNATYLAEDNSERLWKPGDANFQFTTSHAAAQRLAKIELETSRQQITETFPANLAGLQVQAGDTVYRNSTAKGWVSKPFLVIDSKFTVYNDSEGNPALGVDLTLRETASTVYDWNSGMETVVDPAPNSSLPNPFSPVAPGVVSVTESLYSTTGSAGVKSLATVMLGVVDDSSNPDYQLNYRVSGATVWTVMPVTKDTAVKVFDLAPAIYEFRARTFNSLGVASAYSATFTQQLFGLTAPPGNVQNLTVRASIGFCQVLLDQTVDLDVRQGGRLILRWSPKTSGATWNDGILLSPNGYPGDTVTANVPLFGGTYLAKFRDSSGNYSVTEATFVVTEALLTGFSTLQTLTESPAFAGTKTNLAVVGGTDLQLDGAVLWDSLGLVDGLDMIDSLGGISSTGSYAFASAMNLGSVKTARLFPAMTSLAFDTSDTWDSRTTPIDSWGLVDGAVIEDAEVTLYVRTTPDDPAGAPVWGPWHPLPGPADYTFWGAQFRLDYTSGNPTHNRRVTALAVTAKQ